MKKRKLGLKKVTLRELSDATLADLAGANDTGDPGACGGVPPTYQGTCEASCPASCDGTCSGTCQNSCEGTCAWCPSWNCGGTMGTCGTCQFTCPNTGF